MPASCTECAISCACSCQVFQHRAQRVESVAG
jgi:hypothetical protein